MTPIRLTWVLFFLSFLLFSKAQAALVQGLYEAKVEIDNQSASSRRKAMRAALRDVLVKVSGNRELLSHSQIRQNIQEAEKFIRSFRFETLEGQLYYQAEFDQQSVQRMVLNAGFPIWDSRRPDSLLWIAYEQHETGQREILSEASDREVVKQANQVALNRGIPISFPVLDLTDVQQITLYDVWGGFSETIKEASERYGVNYVLSARFYLEHFDSPLADPNLDFIIAPTWVADYTLLYKDTVETATLFAETPEELGRLLVDQHADRMAQQYAINFQGLGSDDSKVEIVFTNIENLTQYVRVSEFLSSLSVVAKATLVNQNGKHSTFALELLGDSQDLLNALRLDDKIRPTLDEFGQEQQNLQFMWIP